MIPYKIYETERLVLKPTSLEDAVFLLELLNSPKWLEYIGDRKVYTIEDAQAYIKTKMLPQLSKLGYSNNTLIRKSDSFKIGICGLHNREGVDGVDIGFALLPTYEKKGYAFESSNKLIQVAFNELGQTQVNAVTKENNSSSQLLLEKLGLKLSGTTNLENEELLVYKMKKQSWKNKKPIER
ncbi:MAG TPA: GNAT family N-acetyltransferase [Flavobacteriaceae bacterium]|nr:GNAT family N-acetyltransferase [Flavobacteriaceae bacterium]